MSTRRSVIRTTALGLTFLAGCTSNISEDEGNPPTEPDGTSENPQNETMPPSESTPDNQQDMTHGIPRTITITDSLEIPEEHDAQLTAEMLEEDVTKNHTARVRVSLTNRATDERVFHPDSPYAPFAGTLPSTPNGLILFAKSPSERASADCWSPDSDDPLYRIMRGVAIRLEPGETVSQELEFWDDYRVKECMPVGTYRFTQSYAVSEGNTTPTSSNENNKTETKELGNFTWGFTVSVSQ